MDTKRTKPILIVFGVLLAGICASIILRGQAGFGIAVILVLCIYGSTGLIILTNTPDLAGGVSRECLKGSLIGVFAIGCGVAGNQGMAVAEVITTASAFLLVWLLSLLRRRAKPDFEYDESVPTGALPNLKKK